MQINLIFPAFSSCNVTGNDYIRVISKEQGNEKMTHLEALQVRLSNEKSYLAAAKTDCEIEMRTVWVSQIEKEISAEYAFLGKDEELPEMTDDELLAALEA